MDATTLNYIDKISDEDLKKLKGRNVDNYTIKQLYYWRVDDYHEYVSWEEFRDSYTLCSNCGFWEKGVCICYTNK